MKEITEILKTYNRQREALLPCLHAIGKKYGRLTEKMAMLLAKELGLPPTEVYSVASFYSMFRFKKKAKYIIGICMSLPCYLKGSKDILAVLKKELKITTGKVSPDKKFAIEKVSCLGCCDKAPVMLVNETRYENLTPRKVREIIRSYKEK
ncbi:MAG: NAD(P)H-dependent oxidoreductase subunit E [Candidatus Omnitrophota bacterium]|nr:NAD(P)H-dependent oxidoreductase subunit E [Candidatus Omnitrophota bacterium]